MSLSLSLSLSSLSGRRDWRDAPRGARGSADAGRRTRAAVARHGAAPRPSRHFARRRNATNLRRFVPGLPLEFAPVQIQAVIQILIPSRLPLEFLTAPVITCAHEVLSEWPTRAPQQKRVADCRSLFWRMARLPRGGRRQHNKNSRCHQGHQGIGRISADSSFAVWNATL